MPLVALSVAVVAAIVPYLPAAAGAWARARHGALTARFSLIQRVAVVPTPGDRYAPARTSITFRGAGSSELAGISVTGSLSGRHAGRLTRIGGGLGEVFTPAHPFAGGETVTVRAPLLDVTGVTGAPFSFRTARPASPAAATAALKAALASEESRPEQAARAASGPAGYTPPACPALTYKSAPNLGAGRMCMNTGVRTSGVPHGTYLFLTPGAAGAGIYGNDGRLYWWSPSKPGDDSMDESVVRYNGAPYLAVWSGSARNNSLGAIVLYDEHYQVAGTIQAGADFGPDKVDLHEFQLTPAGDALVGIYDPVTLSIGGVNQTVVQYVVQELSLIQTPAGISTGALLFEWDSLNDVPVSQSYLPQPPPAMSWDYFHGNAISADPEEGLVVSSRDTWGIYEIDDNPFSPMFEHVIWQVGARGDSTLVQPWCFQHNVTALGGYTYSIFDDGGTGPGCLPGSTQHPARAVIFRVDPSTRPATVTPVATYTHNPPIYAGFTGSAQVLPNRDVLIDWGNVPDVTEYSPTGSVRLDLSVGSFSYRGFRFAWVGEPLTLPSVAASVNGTNTDVWASWNGDTQVATWQVLAGPSATALAPVGKPQVDVLFETHIELPGTYQAVEVQALSSSGTVLGTSAPLIISSPVARLAKVPSILAG